MMDDCVVTGLDPDVLMDLDEGDGSDLDDDDDDMIDEPLPSPFQSVSSAPGSTATSVTSSPPNNDDITPSFNFSGKPLCIKRGRGRPRREGGKPLQRKQGITNKLKKTKQSGMARGGGSTPRKYKNLDRYDMDLSCITPSPSEDVALLDPETGSLIFGEKEKSLPIFEELPYFPEQWPGKVCAFCNLGERSQLGQGELLRMLCPEGFTPQRVATDAVDSVISNIAQTPERESGDKSPRGPVTCRRQKSFNKCRHPSMTSEYVDELTIIGYVEEPDVSTMFETNGYFYAHRNCALWSDGVVKSENSVLENVGPALLQSSSKKCTFCNHYGASLLCKVEGCGKLFHFPCATASGAFQKLSSLTLLCSNHLGQVALICEYSFCYTCKTLGDVANLMFCSTCGEHYHGTCVGLAQLPGVRAGWQCRKCRICQVCRMIGDESKLMTCEQCEKVYHASCQRPIVTSIPKYGWKCRCCRVCGDCGSRTPGAGLSSRWHAHYTVCDSCYQQRNKGFSCPLCHRAYRSHAHREMVQCTVCRKFVHGTCDPEADLITYHQRKEIHPEYEYVCMICKNLTQPGQLLSKRNSTDDPSDSYSNSQESFFDDNIDYDPAYTSDTPRTIGLGKGKPYSASKIAKKRLGLTGVVTGAPGRPKGKGVAGKVGFLKRQKLSDFGRKRGPKAKMRGIFGVPGVGLQRPVSDGKNDEEPGVENRLVLCSAKDKFVLTQDICVMCGALGTDQEGCLIACVQCGQCYHPYCVNVKVTKVILQKGWRCLDCTVCEGCGQRNDEARLILCDDCDISYHIYCMDPPLDYVPHGNWKCKWCAICQSCGATDPGFNCTWMNSYNECGPCASHVNCPSCAEPYSEGDLIIQCIQCERWLHGNCDGIKTEDDAEKCAEEGYTCLLCRPRDVPPPHLVPSIFGGGVSKPPTPTKSPDFKSNNNYFVDGVCLSEAGHNLIKSLSMEQQGPRKKRKKIATVQDKEAGIMATIESVVAGSSTDPILEDSAKLELVDIKDEPQEMYKEGMIWTKDDGAPPEGFTILTMDNGISVLRRKRQRNLQKLGIGGFLVRMRGLKGSQDNDDVDVLPGQTTPTNSDLPIGMSLDSGDKPRKKPARRKIKSKLAETFPPYLQEAFFGKELLDCAKELDNSDSEEEKTMIVQTSKTIQLSNEEIKAVAAVTSKQEKINDVIVMDTKEKSMNETNVAVVPKVEDDNTEDLKDVLNIPGDLLDTDLVNTIMNEADEELAKNTDNLDALTSGNITDEPNVSDPLSNSNNTKDTKDEFSDILGSHFNLETMPNINSKDVEDIFKGVLTDESQESQESNVFPMQNNPSFAGTVTQPITHPLNNPPIRPNSLPTVPQNNLNSPMSFPPQSPYHSEYSNSPQFSPAFSDTASPWVSVSDNNDLDNTVGNVPSTYNQRGSEKMKADEGLGNGATISAVLYANMNHPEWKNEFPNWGDRYKQIIKKWRTLSSDQKAPYLQQARDNRSALRMKKQQQSQMNKETSTVNATTSKPVQSTTATTPVCNIPSTQVPAIIAPESEDQEKIALQQKSAKEAEQERQWRQLQALRQQQAQQQQHVIHEQRVQAMARVQRQISEPCPPFTPQDQSTMPTINSQELNVLTPQSPSSRQILSLGIKSPPYANPNQNIRPTTPSQPNLNQLTPVDANDAFQKVQLKLPPQAAPPLQQTKLPVDPYAHQPATPRPQFTTIATPAQLQNNPVRLGESPEVNRQLRDLLQRQQFKKLDDQLLANKGQQRIWPPPNVESPQDPDNNLINPNVQNTDVTFRHPLPPSASRPRLPMPMQRAPNQMLGVRMPQIGVQNLDPRMKLIIQQQQQRLVQTGTIQTSQQTFANSNVRFTTGTVRPTTVEQYEQFLQRQQTNFHIRNAETQMNQRLTIAQTQMQRTVVAQVGGNEANVNANEAMSNEQEIPDNVTAELEKLEQETNTMVELQGVGDILGGLGDDDDELLAEMGPDFNILEYADPELGALTGEKTNILDLELEEEPLKHEKKINKPDLPKTSSPQQVVTNVPLLKKDPISSTLAANAQILANSPHPPPLAVAQGPNLHNPQMGTGTLLTPQQIQQQMLQQVQQAAALGRPMPPGSKLQTPDGVIGIVTSNNNVQLQISQSYHQRLVASQLQNPKLQMRVGQNVPRMMAMPPNPQTVPAPQPTMNTPRFSGIGAPPPPPPPYPGPPPPYPGSATPQQMGLRMGPIHLPMGHMHPVRSQGLHPLHPQMQRRPLLLEEQPLLLEELLEQEKREQEKQQKQSVSGTQEVTSSSNVDEPEQALLSDHDFERLKADVFSGGSIGINSAPTAGTSNVPQNTWQNNANRPASVPTPQQPTEVKIQTFNANLLPAPPLPPENIVTEQDKQTKFVYEQWLSHQHNVLLQQLKYYETEVQKLRKIRKSLNSKQRQLKKSGNQLADADAAELQRISSEQAALQKYLESSRKQSRQHGMLIQEYQNKQQTTKQQRPSSQPPLMNQPSPSPLGPPASSPVHHTSTSQSPMMSPSASPLTQHNSPLHSPSPMISHSPGPGSVTNLLQSPGSNMSPIQPSPRIGTPHSQGDSSPGPVASPSQICLPPPAPRMTSPQHRRIVTSPVGYTGDLRPGTPQMRFVRAPLDHAANLQQRVTKMTSPLSNYQQKSGTPSPLNSPPPQPINISQQLLQKQLQHNLLQQQILDNQQGDSNVLHSQRAAQLVQQRNFIRQQLAQQQQQQLNQQQQQQNQQQSPQQQMGNQPQPLTPQQHQMMVQQQQQLAKQQQQQIAQLQSQNRMNQFANPPNSPMAVKSPLIGQQQQQQQIMSPHSMPPSPMPPRSPMMQLVGNNQQTPNSPIARSPAFHQSMQQPPSSPMQHNYQPPSSPMMPRSPMVGQNNSPMSRRPPSANSSPAENRMYTTQTSIEGNLMDNTQTGGGNPNNPNNPIPAPPSFGRFGYIKLGLRGGAPMWNMNKNVKRIPTPPTNKDGEKEQTLILKPKKESHLSKVSILKKKSPAKTNLQSLAVSKVNSLVSTDYNEFDDSSCTPPVTPPPHASTSRIVSKVIGTKIIEKPTTTKEIVIDSCEEKTINCDEIIDYDDDNKTVVSTEVSLSSVAQQNDGDDFAVIETFSPGDLGDVICSPLESDQIADEYVLFPGNVVVDMTNESQFSDKVEEVEEEYDEENMHILIRSPTTSDDEFIMQDKTKKFNIIQQSTESTTGKTAESPEPDEHLSANDEETEIGQIYTNEDFEELIDEGTRKEKLKQEAINAKHINEIHKYAASVFSFPQKHVQTTTSPKISLITSPVVQSLTTVQGETTKLGSNIILTKNPTSKLTSLILHNTSASGSNVLNVSSVSPAITIVSANTSHIASILPSRLTVPVISARAVKQLPNVKVIDKPSSSLSLTTHDSSLPKKIFEDDSVSPESSNCDDDKSVKDLSEDKSKTDSPPAVIRRSSKSTDSEDQDKIQIDVKSENKEVPNKVIAKKDVSLKSETDKVSEKIDTPKTTASTSTVTKSPVMVHTTPELKMTAQVYQESSPAMKITARTESLEGFEGSSGDDTKSVVISIPSPTPSQEQMLDNIALQALENRRRDGKCMDNEFESLEDVLDMIENITAEPPTTVLDEPVTKDQEAKKKKTITEEVKKSEIEPKKNVIVTKTEPQVPITVATISKSSMIPQLSPLSQPTELTTNMANASQQLRSLLSSIHTTTTAITPSSELVKSVPPKMITTSIVVTKQNDLITTVSSPVPKVKSPPNQKQTIGTYNQVTTLSVTTSPQTTIRTINTTNVHVMQTAKITRSNSVPTSTSLLALQPIQKPINTSTAPIDTVDSTKKPTYSLTEMLQSQPAVTSSSKNSADTITVASLLGTSFAITKTNFDTSLVQAQPQVTVTTSITTSTSCSTMQSSTAESTITKSVTTTSNLLHTQLTKFNVQKPRTEEIISAEEIKVETTESIPEIKQEPISGCKYSSIQTPQVSRTEDSQNVLLKKLLQNTACASTHTSVPSTITATTVPVPISTTNTDNSSVKMSTLTLASILPPTIKDTPVLPKQTPLPRTPLMSRETSFVSNPNVPAPPPQQPQQPANQMGQPVTQPTQQLHIDIKKCMPPSRTPSRDDLLSPPTPRSSCSQDSSLQTPPLMVKKESQFPQQSPVMMQEVKKEFVDETSQHSEISENSRSDMQIKEELDNLDPNDKMLLEQKEELKKQKRRMYQQKRRQNQIMNKETIGQPKKRPRKNSKVEEDYDTYIDGVLGQLRTVLPPMSVCEPYLNRNFLVAPVFGSEMSKLAANDYDSRYGDLTGEYGNACLPGYSDFYTTKPYGDLDVIPEKPAATTQRGFYDQEFPPIKFDTDEDKRFDLFGREDTPDSIVSSSSPECTMPEPPHRFYGLKLIDENDEDDCSEHDVSKMRLSPVVPLIAPIPIRLNPASTYSKDYADDKENIGRDLWSKSKFASTPTTPLKDSGNVTVTLTLTSSAAEDIMGVLRDLANILHIPAPTSYQIVERTGTPPNQKLGLYRTKGKDGKEGAPIDIQSILNGAAKFCKHCDVVILNNMIRKKVSELPFLAKDSELLSDGDELFFCSSACYMQFALMHRSPSISEDKAAAIIDHLCQKDKNEYRKKKTMENMDQKNYLIDSLDQDLHTIKKDIETSETVMRNIGIFNKFQETRTRRDENIQSTTRVWKGTKYKLWNVGCLQPPIKYKKLTDKEIMELLYRMGITVTPPKLPEDTRKCMFCQGVSDGVADGPARLLNFDVDKWVHLNCGLWSDGVYETVNGALMNLENALQQSLTSTCVHCNKLGATIRCFKTRCSNIYHLSCAVKDGCVFYKNKTVFCIVHVPKNEKDNELTTLSVSRRVYCNRDENRQVAAVMHHSDTNNLLRVGSLIFLSVGQLLPHQLQNFHTPNYIYPIGYKIIRFYWSMRKMNKRCRYICSINETMGRPEFKIVIQETNEEDMEMRDTSPKGVWQQILDQISALRKQHECVQIFPKFVSGEDLFGLTEPAVVRVLESLPGIETLTDYKFKYGRNPLLELPLAINPSGAARTEPRLRNQLHWKRPHTQRTGGASSRPLFGPTPSGSVTNTISEVTCPYSKQFVHSKSSQYKKMKQEWRNNVYLARSKIQGLGLYAARDLEKHTMVIEYIGEIIRTELAETREKQYEAKNRGIYMFRLDEERVVDATLCGGLARYINHSCNPNCVAETVEVDRDIRIIIFAKRRIQRGEELAYDYKFDIEDDQHKISCMCGAPNCRKWMN